MQAGILDGEDDGTREDRKMENMDPERWILLPFFSRMCFVAEAAAAGSRIQTSHSSHSTHTIHNTHTCGAGIVFFLFLPLVQDHVLIVRLLRLASPSASI